MPNATRYGTQRSGIGRVRGDARDLDQRQLLRFADAEPALTAVPIAGEHHRMALDDMQSAVPLEMSGYVETLPEKRALGSFDRHGKKDHGSRKQAKRTHSSHVGAGAAIVLALMGDLTR